MIIVAARRAFDRHPGFPGVGGHVSRGVDHVRLVGIGGIDRDRAEIPAASPQPIFVIDHAPRRARVVGNIDAALSDGTLRRPFAVSAARRSRGRVAEAQMIDRSPQPIRIAGRNSNADLAHEIIVRHAAGELLPGIAAIGRFEQSSARHVRRRVYRPWRTTRAPQRRVHHARIFRIDGDFDRADIIRDLSA